jgi:GNAT superfamily N-acetyltransferase
VERVFGGLGMAWARFDEICDLYDEVFSSPPFAWVPEESVNHRARLRAYFADRSFSAMIALEENELVGFAYGRALGVDSQFWWSRPGLREEVFYAEYPGRTFVLGDLAVRSDRRSRGLGRALVSGLLGRRPEERAILTVQPPAIRTKRFYRRMGWEFVGAVKAMPGSVSPKWEIFVVDIEPFRALITRGAKGNE